MSGRGLVGTGAAHGCTTPRSHSRTPVCCPSKFTPPPLNNQKHQARVQKERDAERARAEREKEAEARARALQEAR